MRVLALLLLIGLVRSAAAAAAPDRPNIVFILSDDQRTDTIHALGNAAIRTPNLDRLVRSGTTFTRAHIMGGLQPAVCAPSRAMLMSGRTLFHVREDLQGTETWPQCLGRDGYRTFLTGKWHNGESSAAASFTEGANVFLGGMTDQNRVRVKDLGPDHRWTVDRVLNQPSSELFGDSAVRFLRTVQGDQPFCLYVAFTSPHDPRTAPPPFAGLYEPRRMPLPRNFLPLHPFDNGEMVVRDEALLPWPRTPGAVRREIADYYAMISDVDAQVGRILAALDETGRRANTVIVFASDNGLALGSHGLMGKQNLYDHSTGVPLVIAGPGVRANRRSDALCYLHDVAPTITELAGSDTPLGNEGRSLVPFLHGALLRSWRNSLFTAYRDSQRAVRDDRWKLIRYPMLNRSQLFDLRRDPDERHDLSSDPRHAADVARMMEELRRLQAGLGDTLPLSTNRPGSGIFVPPHPANASP